MDAVERGGSFGRANDSARATMCAAGTGAGFRFHAAESSPFGSFRRVGSRRIVIATILILTLAGGTALAQGLWIVAKAVAGQVLLQLAWQRSLESATPLAPWPWADTRPIARLYAPAQHANLLVLSGATGRTLAWGPGHLDGSAAPGGPGHAVITAHRDTHFAFLAHVAPGEEIVVERVDRSRHRYRIVATTIVDHRALRLASDVAVPTLTLVTCWPFDAVNPGGPLRYVVTAHGVGVGSKRGLVSDTTLTQL